MRRLGIDECLRQTPAMSILSTVRAWRASRRERKLEAYAENLGNATPEERANTKWSRLRARATGGMPEGTGISPTGTPIDFTADEKPPRY